jgi:hypothetical protein
VKGRLLKKEKLLTVVRLELAPSVVV